MSEPDFILFPWTHARDGYTHSGRFSVNGVHYWIEARIVPAAPDKHGNIVMEHLEGRLAKADQRAAKAGQKELAL